MHILSLQLTHFRNYQELSLAFSPGINCFAGVNGAGKTNVLDALHYLAFTRGFRSSQDKMALQEGEPYFFIKGEVEREGIKRELQCNFVKGKGKKLLTGGKPLKKMSEHIGKVPLVVILPADTELINGPSVERRRFLDMLISQYSHAYLNHLIQYERILAQRNALLKQFSDQGGFDPEQLELWSTQLIPHGIAINKEREAFIQEFKPIFNQYFHRIVSQKEQPEIRYRSQLEENSIDGWLALFKRYEQRDRFNLYTGAGIHRDDLIFQINEQSVRNYGSQGQQKTFVIALRLAEYELLQTHTMVPPILLLDDLFDKLDEHRLSSIAHLLERELEGQIFVTDTSLNRLKEVFGTTGEREIKCFRVEAGKVSEDV